jgi:hypothetical protein
MLVLVPSVICIAALPLTPSGLGVRENLFVHMLNDEAMATRGLSLALLAYVGFLIWSVVGWIVYVLFKDKHHLRQEDLSPRADSVEG